MITKKEFIEALLEEGIQPDKGEWIYNNLEPNWKPTEEQMSALSIAINDVHDPKVRDIVDKLHKELERLVLRKGNEV